VEILSLNPEGFRNLGGGRFESHPRLNLVVGDNGQGKTNLLEALGRVSHEGILGAGQAGAGRRTGAGER
jgi:recombinational DNA repair ATPase RecF